MRSPERFPCACARAADVAAHAVPGGPSPRNFISGRGRPNPHLLQRGELCDGRGKSSLLWIVIIILLTPPMTPPPNNNNNVCVCVCVSSC